MTSQRQFIKGCECGIVLDANTFCNILGLRRVYVLLILPFAIGPSYDITKAVY